MKYLIAVFFLTLFFSCNSKTEENKQTQPNDKPTSSDKKINSSKMKDNQTIIEASDNLNWVFEKNYKSWTPGEKDIEAAESLLVEWFEKQKMGTINRMLGRTPDEYYRQFVGAEYENGDKIIWINCFCSSQLSDFKDWKTKLAFVKDGGNCFFNMKVNITRNTCIDFLVNGNG